MIIDLHSHLLPGLDDGPKTLEESIKLAKLAVSEGIRYSVLTPHSPYKKNSNTASEVISATETLKAALQAENIPLKIYASQEIEITKDFLDDFEDDQLLSLDGRGKYYLLKLPEKKLTEHVFEVLEELLIEGITPIISNPEQHPAFMDDVNQLYDLVAAGCIAQLSAASYMGEHGPEIQDLAYQMLELNLVHLIASDAHEVSPQAFNLKKAFVKIQNVYGTETARYLHENARLVFNGEPINRRTPEESEVKAKKRFLGIF
ncbi:MAG: hypothetical protein Q4B80_00735 [Aerococcaceae bacterium]|nr:hypothetical protein [Aerococcaceae bacterium]